MQPNQDNRTTEPRKLTDDFGSRYFSLSAQEREEISRDFAADSPETEETLL